MEMDLHIFCRKGIVIAFVDDISAMKDTRAIVRLAPLVEDIFAQDGFHVKVTKSTSKGSDIETSAMIDPFQMISGCALKVLQCSGFPSGTENTVDRWPSASSAICSQAVLPYRSWAPGLLLLPSCSPSISAPSS